MYSSMTATNYLTLGDAPHQSRFCEIGYLCVNLSGRSARSTCEREDTEAASAKAEVRVSKQSKLDEFRDQLEGFRTRTAFSLL
jgi:hypothetical protein